MVLVRGEGSKHLPLFVATNCRVLQNLSEFTRLLQHVAKVTDVCEYALKILAARGSGEK